MAPIFLTLLLLTIFQPTQSQSTHAQPSDVKYIKCQTCTHLAKALVAQINAQANPTDLSILDLTESICDAKSPQGSWLRKIDLVERLRRLRLVEQTEEQDCTRECRTLALACHAVLDGHEMDLAHKLYALIREKPPLQHADVDAWFCAKRTGLSSACRVVDPFFPSGRSPGPSFAPRDKKGIEMESMMQRIRAGNGGQDFSINSVSRDQFGAGMANPNDDDDDDDDDEVEDDNDRKDNDESGDNDIKEETKDEVTNSHVDADIALEDLDNMAAAKLSGDNTAEINNIGSVRVGTDEL